ncbi:MAG TPA: peptide chain release factor 1 [Rhodothermales bacterium]|nr:peptide chain release factor 1 [Rhodothermales bacterium]HRR08870.1 peptide chain release factor 1 [Rhodothermales bacterium]
MIQPEKLTEIQEKFNKVSEQLADPAVATNVALMAQLGKEHRELEALVQIIERYHGLKDSIDELKDMIRADEDEELTQLARFELSAAEEQLPKIEEELSYQLIPQDPEDSKNCIVEIRAGTGGDEASLFAGDLFRMYTRFAEKKGWKVELIDENSGTMGGFKEVVFGLEGVDAFGMMRFESGVHRVQRVPATESSGRIHTSAATVAVLPEAEEVDVQINEEELRIDTMRASGAGGQHVNRTESAIRITHLPTGLVVTCQDEKSQHKNKDKAMKVLRSRLFDLELAKRNAERTEHRRSLVGTGDRSDKIRTYNWPQARVTDHRLEGAAKNYALQTIVDGNIEGIIQALRMADYAERLAQF